MFIGIQSAKLPNETAVGSAPSGGRIRTDKFGAIWNRVDNRDVGGDRASNIANDEPEFGLNVDLDFSWRQLLDRDCRSLNSVQSVGSGLFVVDSG